MEIRGELEVSEEALAEVCRRYGVARLAVFGSSARGDFHRDSDVDLLVEFHPEERVGLLRFGSLQIELGQLLGQRVDLVAQNGLKPLLREEVLREARALYAA